MRALAVALIFVKRKQPVVGKFPPKVRRWRVFQVAMRNRGANWRKMAEDAKAMADRIHDPTAKLAMQEIAERYEVLAAYSERQAKKEAERCSPSSGEHSR
jgi:hypothetical protein